MHNLFIGTYEHTLDEKGRVSVPGRFREQMNGEREAPLIVTKNTDPGCRCLFVYTAAAWETFAEKLNGASFADPAILRAQRLFLASAADCPVDKTGRVLVPPTLRDWAGLSKAVIWAGSGRRMEIWDKARWDDEDQRNREGLDEINQALLARGI